jgi:hypothetical protein
MLPNAARLSFKAQQRATGLARIEHAMELRNVIPQFPFGRSHLRVLLDQRLE